MAGLRSGFMSDLTGEATELLQAMIRNGCVNDGTPESGQEVRTVDLLQTYLEGSGLDVERFESIPGRASIVSITAIKAGP